MIRDHEAVAIAVHVEASHNVLAAEASEYEMAGLYFDQIAVLGQTIQCGIEFRPGRAATAKLSNELLEGRSSVGKTGDVVEDGGVGHALAVDWT
jgi:hypothetical protein